jgi:colanic acid biosynthesis glycosyl transferase WcaI
LDRRKIDPVRILIYGINFAPELVGTGKSTGEMAEWLAAGGHEVRAITAPPFNPAWQVASGYSAWRYSRESYFPQSAGARGSLELAAVATAISASQPRRLVSLYATAEVPEGVTGEAEEGLSSDAPLGGLTVFRCPVWVPRRPSAARRVLHLVSFALSSSLIMLRQVRWKPEVVLVIEPTLFCAPAAWLTGRLSAAKTWLHVQDFEADAGFEMGLLHSRALRSLVGALEKKCMSGFDRVSTISEKMLMRLPQKGVASSRSVLFRNWVDTNLIFPLSRPNPLRAEWGISQEDVVALYSGTMGHKQGLKLLADTAQSLAPRQRLRFVFCGEGPGKPALAALAAQLPNVKLFPIQPAERLNDLLNLADIHLLPQRADAADLVMPSKLTGMLASGRPVVATAGAGTQLAQVVEGRGLVVPPGDASAFSAAIVRLADSPGLRETLGKSARAYALSDLAKEKVLSRFEQELLFAVCGNRSRQPARH